MPQPAFLSPQATPEEAARGFLSTYGSLFGLRDQSHELTVMRSKKADRGRAFVRFQQVYSGIPIMGGEVIVQVNSSNNILSANGEVLPDIDVDTSPQVTAAEAQEKALQVALREYGQKYAIERNSLNVTDPELWIYNPTLLGLNVNITHLVWRMEVLSKDMLPIRELFLIDAHLGMVVLHFNQFETARNRLIYDHNNTPGKPLPGDPGDLMRIEGDPLTGIPEVDNAYDYAGDTYDFYWNNHGRDSIDNVGMDIVATTRWCPDAIDCPTQNAFWDGSRLQFIFGDGFASADDVVGHEYTHGVTNYESGLFYYMQSGAINESFSDIWGEFVDLTNGRGNDDPSVRWLLGEDSPLGAIRSLKDPPANNYPDRMGSPLYDCDPLFFDNGGVHSNSGVANKAAYLLTDGDTFNGYTVVGLGIDKVADLFYEVQTNLFTSASDYQDLYDALIQAAINLGFDASDSQQVQNAVDATELTQQPPGCPAPEAPVCDSGPPGDLFFDDLENTGSGNWTHGAIVGVDEWYYPQPPIVFFGSSYATSGQYHFFGYDQGAIADIYMAMTFDVSLAPGSSPYMHFNHAYHFEFGAENYDGGVVEYSIDGGVNWNDAGPLFTDNGYNGTLSSAWQNPLGGRQAFVNLSNGYISSRLDLSSLVGQDVRFRFRIGTDEMGGYMGWFIDDIRIYTCVNTTPPPSPPQNLGKTDGNPDTPCFIATAAYGSPYGNYIDLLRAFRDEYLMIHPIGKKWVTLYYRYSPPMAGFIADHPKMKKGIRIILYPFVALSAGMVQTTTVQKGLVFCFIVGLLLGMALLSRRRKAEKWVSLIDPS
jgi:Zn-dependent metalloprotease